MSIKKGFDQGAKEYDLARKHLIPCFDDFYAAALELVPFIQTDKIKVLDLGAGTGLFALLVAERYPNAQLTLYDLSSAMLEEAKTRFANQDTEVDYVAIDYADNAIKGKYDLIISALSIHHLTGVEKENLFKKIYASLNDNGYFINADQVLGETAEIEKNYRDVWLKQVKEKGVTQSSLSSALERMKEDKMSTLTDQLMWLENAKFKEVNCRYKNDSFVVYSARKDRKE